MSKNEVLLNNLEELVGCRLLNLRLDDFKVMIIGDWWLLSNFISPATLHELPIPVAIAYKSRVEEKMKLSAKDRRLGTRDKVKIFKKDYENSEYVEPCYHIFRESRGLNFCVLCKESA